MLATKQIIQYKIQSRVNLGFTTASNQDEGLVRMTDFSYTSIIWLTQGKYAIVDNEDHEHLSQWKWCVSNIYAARWRSPLMHCVIMDKPQGKQIDHINGNPLDNRKANLRLCSNAENQRNRIKINSASGFKGVCWHKGERRWRAQIKYNGKTVYLGQYKDIVSAARAYDKKALELFGEFAKTNEMLGLYNAIFKEQI